MSLTWTQRAQYFGMKTGIRETVFILNLPFHWLTSKIHHTSCSMLSYEKMVQDTILWCKILQHHDYDLIVGVPRVGMMIATIIACQLNLPLATPDSAVDRVTYFPGHMVKPNVETIMVVDDAVKRGMELWKAKDAVQHAYPYARVTSGALYTVTPFAKCDIFYTQPFGYTSQESDLQQPLQTP